MSPSSSPPIDASSTTTEPRRKQRDLWQRYNATAAGSTTESELVQQYLPLVKTVVGRLAMTLPSHVDVEDLYSAGLVGLLEAIRHFDRKHGASFETYARFRIRGAVFDELRRMDWVPRSVHDKARKIQAAMQELEQAKGRLPDDGEVAAALNVSMAEYQRWLDEIKPATFLCLDSTAGPENDEGTTRYEGVPNENQQNPFDDTVRREMTQLVLERLQQLPEMQRKVLALYYYEDLRLREIAEVFGVTESRICQIHAQAVTAIRAYLHKHDACPA